MSTERGFADHFSGHAAVYAKYRPSYPEALYERLSTLVERHERAWDVATGSGQAARHLAQYFREVIATDASAEQLAHAHAPDNVVFEQALSEDSGLDDASVDLVSIAAAIHWFDLDAFYAEVRRVARPGAVIAAWSYSPHAVIDQGPIDALIRKLSDEILAEDWAPQLRHAVAEYRALPFPFQTIEFPKMDASADWTVEELLGKLRSWSGVQAHQKTHGKDPLELVEPKLRTLWAAGPEHRRVAWPLFFKVGRVG